MNYWLKFTIAVIVVIAVFDIIVGLVRKWKRRHIFAIAKKRSEETGFPLLVVGDPYNGLMSIMSGPDYECGDVCLDLTGCKMCPHGIKGRLEEKLRGIDLSRTVVYISCVLEYVNDLPLILGYLNKMDPNNLFIVNVEWFSLMAYFYPYFLTNEEPPKYVITECPPWQNKIVYYKI